MIKIPFLILLPFIFGIDCGKLSESENEYLQSHCGKPEPLILPVPIRRSMHTKKAARADAPWIVALQQTVQWFPNMSLADRDKEKASYFSCSGTLISPRHVLTAGHCVVQLQSKCTPEGDVIESTPVRGNIDRITAYFAGACEGGDCKDVGLFPPYRVAVKQIFVSNRYTDYGCDGISEDVHVAGDIAVIELTENVSLNDQVYTACLNDREIHDGEELTLYGYGENGGGYYSIALRRHNSTVSDCYKKKNFDTLCTKHDFASACSGDSGGGHILHDRRGAAYVGAVVSGGAEQCHTMISNQLKGPVTLMPNFNTNVNKHLMWICAATGICVNKTITESVKSYEERGLTQSWYTHLKPLTGNSIYV